MIKNQVQLLKYSVELWNKIYVEYLERAYLYGANLSSANLSSANLSSANLSGTIGLSNPIAYLESKFKKIKSGFIVYKIFDLNYQHAQNWKIESGSIIEEIVNFDRCTECACGINVASLDWINKQNSDEPIWKCLIEFEWLAGVCVPYNTDGKIRTSRLQLLEIIK